MDSKMRRGEGKADQNGDKQIGFQSIQDEQN
jgi:hypothetical protein